MNERCHGEFKWRRRRRRRRAWGHWTWPTLLWTWLCLVLQQSSFPYFRHRRTLVEAIGVSEGARDTAIVNRALPASCTWNQPVGLCLRPSAAANSTNSLDIGSKSGEWAFLLSDGAPRLLQGKKRAVQWTLGARAPKPQSVGCPRYTTRFDHVGGLRLVCRGTTWLKVTVERFGLTAARIAIDDKGIVRFFALTGRLLLAIGPGRKIPTSVLTISTRVVTRTSSRALPSVQSPAPAIASRTLIKSTLPLTSTPSATSTSRTATTYTSLFATPTFHPANTISPNSGCTYLPVPYPIPFPNTPTSSVFNIELLSCASDPSQNAAFIAAAQKWMSVITADLSDFTWGPQFGYFVPLSDFEGHQLARIGFVDDLLIAFSVRAIDGPYGVLGQGGPTYYRSWSTKHPFTGYMFFDSADWEIMRVDGTLENVVMHEMGHVLGFGTMWSYYNLILPSDCWTDSAGVEFLGPLGTQAAMELGVPYPAIEDEGGSRCSHWDEAMFGNELMTGLISGAWNPLSNFTVQSFADMGYEVDDGSKWIDRGYRPPGKNWSVKKAEMGCLDAWKKRVIAPLPATGRAELPDPRILARR